jgi:hypothetical protein
VRSLIDTPQGFALRAPAAPGLSIVLVLVAGCSVFSSNVDNHQGLGGGNDSTPFECREDMDCAAVGAKCCDCPTYAAPVDDPAVRACADVMCPQSSCPANVLAACLDGACVLACRPSACDMSCPYGFQMDATGCLECMCAMPPAATGCQADRDCVRVAADCCGCAHGGHDTAVLATDAASYAQALMCPSAPMCPDSPSCPTDLTPQCVEGTCQLAPPIPPGACGRPDLPTCPPGTMCTINANDTSAQQGVGVCM